MRNYTQIKQWLVLVMHILNSAHYVGKAERYIELWWPERMSQFRMSHESFISTNRRWQDRMGFQRSHSVDAVDCVYSGAQYNRLYSKRNRHDKYRVHAFTHCLLLDIVGIAEDNSSNRSSSLTSLVKLLSGECHGTCLIISQHLYRQARCHHPNRFWPRSM